MYALLLSGWFVEWMDRWMDEWMDADTTIAYMYDLCLKRLTRKLNTSKQKNKLLTAAASSSNVAKRGDNKGDKEGKEKGEEGEEEDPHYHIQQVLLSHDVMPSLQYFISTYSPDELNLLKNSRGPGARGNTWRLVLTKKLPCCTDSYMFYVYERVVASVEYSTGYLVCDQ
jgi:hypothetical protein